jgi:DNA-binding response OmpR family regulator
MKKKIGISITDWMIPELDGPGLCNKIKEVEWPYYVYIILLTSSEQWNNSVKGLENTNRDDVKV